MPNQLNDFFKIYAPHIASQIGEDTLLIDCGLLDSLLLMNLVAFVENNYNINIPDDEIVPANFRTIASIREFIARLRHSV